MQRERNEGVPAPRYEVIGVVGDIVPTLEDRASPTLYRPLLDIANSGSAILLHTAVDPPSIAGAVRNEIRELDPGLATFQVRTMDEVIGTLTTDRQFTMLLFVAFAGLAVLLAAVGLYGVVSYGVSQRTAEIGIRMALGATGGDVRRLVIRQGLRPAIAGIAIGLVAAAFASRVMKTLLFRVSPADPLTFLLVPPLLLAVAAIACFLPALPATHLDPTLALRSE